MADLTTVYFYSPTNNEYTATGSYETGGTQPANSTVIQPPTATPNVACIWTTDHWASTPDFRGFIYATADGTRSFMSVVGAIPGGYVHLAPPDFPIFPTAYDYSGGAWSINNARVVAAIAATARGKRNGLLAASDWTEGPGAVITAASLQNWSEYRQWLRDLPAQGGFPSEIVWPTIPAYAHQTTVDSVATKLTAIQAGVAAAIANPLG